MFQGSFFIKAQMVIIDRNVLTELTRHTLDDGVIAGIHKDVLDHLVIRGGLDLTHLNLSESEVTLIEGDSLHQSRAGAELILAGSVREEHLLPGRKTVAIRPELGTEVETTVALVQNNPVRKLNRGVSLFCGINDGDTNNTVEILTLAETGIEDGLLSLFLSKKEVAGGIILGLIMVARVPHPDSCSVERSFGLTL
jgi:hypothetical protein